jgi:hypothetical protein
VLYIRVGPGVTLKRLFEPAVWLTDAMDLGLAERGPDAFPR